MPGICLGVFFSCDSLLVEIPLLCYIAVGCLGAKGRIDTIKHHTWPRTPTGKRQTHSRHHKQEPRGQPPPPPPPSRWPQSTHKQTPTKTQQTQDKTKTQKTHKRSTAPERPAKHPTGGPKPAQRRQPQPQPRRGPRHTDTRPAWKTPNPPTHHPLKHTNQDTTRRQSKDKDSTVNKTEHQSKRNQTGKPRRAW